MGPLDAIIGSTLFRGLPAAACQPFVSIACPRRLNKGDYLFRLGEPANTLFIIRSGTVHLTMPLTVRANEREIVVQEAGIGETLAWSALIEPCRFTMSARGGSDIDLLAFATRDMRAAFAANPDAGLQVMTNLATVIAQRLQVMHAICTRDLQRAVQETFG